MQADFHHVLMRYDYREYVVLGRAFQPSRAVCRRCFDTTFWSIEPSTQHSLLWWCPGQASSFELHVDTCVQDSLSEGFGL